MTEYRNRDAEESEPYNKRGNGGRGGESGKESRVEFR